MLIKTEFVENENNNQNREAIDNNKMNLVNVNEINENKDILIPINQNNLSHNENNDSHKQEEAKENNQIQHNKTNVTEKPNYTNSKQANGNRGNSIFNRIILPQIRKQIEFYFSDKNYYHDAFLLEKAKENEENCNKDFFIFKFNLYFNQILS